MNRLPDTKRALILQLLVEGSSMRSASRIAGAAINTVTKLLEDAGDACAEFHHEFVRGVRPQRIECDEIWAFCYAKRKNVAYATAAPPGAGDAWTWTALDPDSKLLLTWTVGQRDLYTGMVFADDLRFRVEGKPQITTDGLASYVDAIEATFGADVDYAQLVKQYDGRQRYIGAERMVVIGHPDIARVSTSLVERQNLTMRMSMRRFTRKTNAFSKKIENHCHMVAIYAVYYNFVREHRSLGKEVTPAMAAGIASKQFDMEWLVGLSS